MMVRLRRCAFGGSLVVFGVVFFASAPVALGDVYLHSPRGSNDRNCERNANRNNGNRLFDSQNNAAGGYACPRAVGDELVQNEAGEAAFSDFTQKKKVYFYEGSEVIIEWTQQHGCGENSKVNCEIVLQYTCSDLTDPFVASAWPSTSSKSGDEPYQAYKFRNQRATPRDGVPRDRDDSATDTIPDSIAAAIPDSVETRRYGMHESVGQYELCQRTERNKGLYTADQSVRRSDARGTRQNPQGNRRGLECPEERDYYPHWAPSPWIDIAVLTNDASEDGICTRPNSTTCSNRCKYYLENSFNKNKKGFCDVPRGQPASLKLTSQAWQRRQWYNNKAACEANGFAWFGLSLEDLYGEENVDYPFCAKTQFARVNQLGNAVDSSSGDDGDDGVSKHGVNANRLSWTVPSIPKTTPESYYPDMEEAYASCTLRIRYNISTSDFPAWPSEAMDDGHPWRDAMVTAANNSNQGDSHRNTPLYQDPYVYIGAGDDEEKGDMFLSLALNTNQYARTFQDRTYTFEIRKRPTSTSEADLREDRPAIPQELVDALDPSTSTKVYNVNVRGKRGNIVQTYPAVEYDFVPNSLALNPNDVVHFQWTGSDYNPRRGCNDGEGGPPDPNDYLTSSNSNSRADRSNVVFLNAMSQNVPRDMAGYLQAARSSLDFATRTALSRDAILRHTPCTQCTDDSSSSDCDDDDDALLEACVDVVRRLAFLNQQSDGGSLELRQNRPCLTEADLDGVSSKAERENHPLNCAKLNAKPYPYFDAGFLVARRPGFFAYFSSRNNNFSNRDQTGLVCVRAVEQDDTCPRDDTTGVLQDANPAVDAVAFLGNGGLGSLDAQKARCFEEAANTNAANAQGASSCQTPNDAILDGETIAAENKDNDAIGDGNADPCDIIFWNFNNSKDEKKVSRYLTLAVVLLFAGIVGTWLLYFAYNRYRANRNKQRKFKEGDDWKSKKESELE